MYPKLSNAEIKFALGTDDARTAPPLPNFSISRTSRIYGVVGAGPRPIETFRRGLVRRWAKGLNSRYRMRIARADGVATKRSGIRLLATQVDRPLPINSVSAELGVLGRPD